MRESEQSSLQKTDHLSSTPRRLAFHVTRLLTTTRTIDTLRNPCSSFYISDQLELIEHGCLLCVPCSKGSGDCGGSFHGTRPAATLIRRPVSSQLRRPGVRPAIQCEAGTHPGVPSTSTITCIAAGNPIALTEFQIPSQYSTHSSPYLSLTFQSNPPAGPPKRKCRKTTLLASNAATMAAISCRTYSSPSGAA